MTLRQHCEEVVADKMAPPMRASQGSSSEHAAGGCDPAVDLD